MYYKFKKKISANIFQFQTIKLGTYIFNIVPVPVPISL